MKKKRHSPEQIIRKLREAEGHLSTGMTIGQVCRKLDISEQTSHRWRNQYGGMKASDAKRLKEDEHALGFPTVRRQCGRAVLGDTGLEPLSSHTHAVGREIL